MDDIEKFFYSIQTIIHISWDLDKINSPTDPNKDPPYLSPEALEKQLKFCRPETVTMVALYRSLEGLVQRADIAELGSPAVGPSGRDLSINIKETKEAFFARINGLLGVMSHHLTTLTNTVDSLDPEKNDILYGRTMDLKDSMENKMERLEMQIKKWEWRINHFARKGIICNLSPIN